MATSSPVLPPEALHSLLDGPAGPPPPGVIPNFHDPPNLNVLVIITITLCVFSTTTVVLIRMYTRFFLMKSKAWEDFTILLAWIGQIGQTIPSGLTTRYGVGVHIWNVQLKSFFKMLYWVDIAMIVYNPAIFFIKLSILLQYLRLFRPMKQGNKFLHIGVHVCLWSCLLFYLLEFIFQVMLCIPRSKISNPLAGGKCWSSNALLESTGVFNVISNFAIIILPIPSVWDLQVPMRKKVGIAAIFLAGFFACVASIIRTTYAGALNKSLDRTYNLCAVGLWTYAEIAIGIIVACLPVTPRFFQFIVPKLQNSIPFGYKFKSANESALDSAGLQNGIDEPSKLNGRFNYNHSRVDSVDSDHPQSQLQRDYYTLTEVSSVSTERDSSSIPIQNPDQGNVVSFSDMTHGRPGIRVERTIEIEVAQGNSDTRTSDLSEQKYMVCW